MSTKDKSVIIIISTVIVFAIAILVWAYQSGKVTIFGDSQSHNVIFDFNTPDQWKSGEFANTVYHEDLNLLSARFDYGQDSIPSFSINSSMCNIINESINVSSFSLCSGIVKLSQKSDVNNKTNDTVYLSDGKIYQTFISPDNSLENSSTCYSGEDLKMFSSLADGTGFWDMVNLANKCDECSFKNMELDFGNKKNKIAFGNPAMIPEKIYRLYQILFEWPQYHKNLQKNETQKDYSDLDSLKCYPESGWGNYQNHSQYTTAPIGSENIIKFDKFSIDRKNFLIPSDNRYRIIFQFAGSKDNYNAWSNEIDLRTLDGCEKDSDSHICEPTNNDKIIEIGLDQFPQLLDSKYLKIRIKLLYLGIDGKVDTQNTMDLSPLVSSFEVSAEEKGFDIMLPTAPSNLKISDIGNDYAVITWMASPDDSGVKYYHIYNSNNDQEIGASRNEYSILSDLNPGTNYKFYIKTEDASGNYSRVSDEISFSTLGNDIKSSSSILNNKTTSAISSIKIFLKFALVGSILWINLLLAFIFSLIVLIVMFGIKSKPQ